MFGDIEVEKHKFCHYENPISIYDVNIGKVVVSNDVSLSKKCFKYYIWY